MFSTYFRAYVQALSEHSTTFIIALFFANLLFNILANSCFKASSSSPTWQVFLAWQIIGNLAGFLTVITLTGLLCYLPLGVVFPVTTGLAVIGVELVSSRILFREVVTSTQWLGTLFIALGIVLVTRK
jgi:multidrug transporter EmrE-like cation transporter